MTLATSNIENDPEEAQSGSPASGSGVASKGALSSMAGGPNPLTGALTDQIKNLEKTRSEKKKVIDEAIANLSTKQPQGPTAEDYFRLMGAFAAPTKTGGFAETLGEVGKVGADILGKRREKQSQLQDLATKYKLQGLDVDSEHLQSVISAHKELQGANNPVSQFGKIAKDEGLQPGTPAFNARVQELSAEDAENKKAKATGNINQKGQFNKQGDFVAPNGAVIKATEIKGDRQERDSVVKLQDAIKRIDSKTVKNAQGWDWTGSDTSKFIAGKFMPKQLQAQISVNAANLQDRLKNLPPGPASDKDIAQARSTFPGFGDAGALQKWLDDTNTVLQNYINRQDAKYGDASWYGAGAAPTSTGKETPAGGAQGANASPAPAQGGEKKASSGTPKVGAIYKGHKYLGGDPADQSSWQKV